MPGKGWSVTSVAEPLRCARALVAPPLLALLLALVVPASFAQEQSLVEFGSSLTYLANSSDPGIGMDWVDPAFPDGGWSAGTYGIGYDTAGSAQSLLATEVPSGTVSIYTRATFNVTDPGTLTSLWFGSDHDDGVVIWINGTEVFRSTEMPPSESLDWNTSPQTAGEASTGPTPDYAPYHDISSSIPLLTPGLNLLAVGVWNLSAGSNDLVLAPRLVANKQQVSRRRDMPMSERFLTIGEVAAELGLPRWRLAYFVERGVVSGPTVEVPGRRLFTSEQVEVIREQLAARQRLSRPTGKTTPTVK